MTRSAGRDERAPLVPAAEGCRRVYHPAAAVSADGRGGGIDLAAGLDGIDRHLLFREAAAQSGVGHRELDAVDEDHRRHVDPHQEHDHRRDRAVHAEPRQVAHVPAEPLQGQAPQHAGHDRAGPDVAEPDPGVGHEVEQQPDDHDEDQARQPLDEEAAQPRERRQVHRLDREPAAQDHGPRRQQDQPGQHQQAGRDQHQERHQLVLPVAERLHLEGVVDGAGDGPEEAERRPHHDDAAADAEPGLALPEGIELLRDEVELAREVLQDEAEDRRAIVIVGADAAEDRQAEQQEREEREQRVERDRRGEGQVVAAIEADEAVPRRPAHEAGQAQGRASDAPADAMQEGGRAAAGRAHASVRHRGISVTSPGSPASPRWPRCGASPARP